MDPATAVLIPGVLGGLIVAAIVIALERRQHAAPAVVVPIRLPITSDVINMASIKVAGLGGLGLVVMAATVAIDVPRIGQSIAVGFGLGLLGAVAAIVWRRRTGPLPSSGRHVGANTVLAIDDLGPRTRG